MLQTTPEHLIDMITANGHVVNYRNPLLTTVDPEDLRIHTKNICRYNGALHWPLARHLALCAKLASNRINTHMQKYNSPEDDNERTLQTAYCASHDFHEIYCTDVVSGMKKYMPEYQKIENRWENYVHNFLGLPLGGRNNDFVRYVDQRALVIEMTCLEHPASDLVGQRYGGPATDNEILIFERIRNIKLDASWKLAWKAFEAGRRIFMTRTGYTVDIF